MVNTGMTEHAPSRFIYEWSPLHGYNWSPLWLYQQETSKVTNKMIQNKRLKGIDIYIPPLTGKPWPGAVYNNSKWRTDRQWL